MINLQLPQISRQLDNTPTNHVAQVKLTKPKLIPARIPFANPNANIQALNNQTYYPTMTQDKLLDQISNKFSRCPH